MTITYDVIDKATKELPVVKKYSCLDAYKSLFEWLLSAHAQENDDFAVIWKKAVDALPDTHRELLGVTDELPKPVGDESL
ncbi:hypothetical protein GP475_09620 [Corynebacterium poyangense]|uniref:Uncharacterized protein n=1 Tax=Corynebacterium poyangense TaxID=2684405 RepID=A0A7H0SQP3_9CORY|nr:hypothetical protein [Corynebacterium poyangense]QNQ90868.1 hypothetical protein GP475_09620 [Corynebacterium poyangense]